MTVPNRFFVDKEMFSKRREELSLSIKEGIAIIPSGTLKQRSNDTEYSFRQNKYGKLIVVKNAKCFHRNFIQRKSYFFGKKEVINRYYFVKKHKLSLIRLFIGIIIKMIMNLSFLQLYKVFGNLIGLFTVLKSYFLLTKL